MSDTWSLEAVADSKPEAPPEQPPVAEAPAIPSVLSSDHSLGAVMTMAREARGFSREQAAKASNIPGYYLTMIETDDYSSIADQLYLLPFLRRYAVFVNLEPEEVASRFIREVQRADMNPGRAPEPIEMFAARRSFPWRAVALTAGAIAIGAIGWFGYRYYTARKTALLNSRAPVSSEQVVPDSEAAAPKAADSSPEQTTPQHTAPEHVAPAPMSFPSTMLIPDAAPSAAIVGPGAVAASAAPSPAAVAPAASPPKPGGHSAAPGSSSRSSAPHLRGSLRSAATSHRSSMQN
jgi:cytoskeletal protein RodZ